MGVSKSAATNSAQTWQVMYTDCCLFSMNICSFDLCDNCWVVFNCCQFSKLSKNTCTTLQEAQHLALGLSDPLKHERLPFASEQQNIISFHFIIWHFDSALSPVGFLHDPPDDLTCSAVNAACAHLRMGELHIHA